MLVLLGVESLVYLEATKAALDVDIPINHELKVTGFGNLLVAAAMGAPGYSQVKFTLINTAIVHNTEDRKVGWAAAVRALWKP